MYRKSLKIDLKTKKNKNKTVKAKINKEYGKNFAELHLKQKVLFLKTKQISNRNLSKWFFQNSQQAGLKQI